MDTVSVLILFFIILLIFALCYKISNRRCSSKRRLDGLTCLVTGGTSGMGLEMAIDFAKRGARVIVACPVEKEGNIAKSKIISESGNNNVEFVLLDLASFQSVRQFAANFMKTENRLDILMNNAGVGVPHRRTEDGLNIITQVNYFGPFLLTILLLPLLKKSGTQSLPSRIVNTTSILHWVPIMNVDRLQDMRGNVFTKVVAYGNSKLCLLLFSRELTKRISNWNVVINDADPGLVRTGIFFSAGRILGPFFYLLALCGGYTAFEGAQAAIFAAVDEKEVTSGRLFRNCQISTPSPMAKDNELAKRVWDKSVQLVNLSKDELGIFDN